MAGGSGDGRRRLMGLVASKLTRREPARCPRALRRAPWLAACGLALAVVAMWASDGHPAAAGMAAATAIALAVAAALRWFKTMFAVASLGICFSVASLMTVLAVSSGFELELSRTFARVHGHVVVTKYGLDFFEYEDVAAHCRRDARVESAAPFAWGAGAMVVERDEAVAGEYVAEGKPPAVVVIKGMLPGDAGRLEGLESSLTGGDASALRPADPGVLPGVVVGRSLARRVGVAPGDRVAIVVPEAIRGWGVEPTGEPHRAVFEVTDLLDTGMEELDGHLVLMHLSAAQAILFGEARATGIEVSLADPRDAIGVADDLARSLQPPGPVRLFRTSTWVEQSASMQAIRHARAVIGIVVGLMVLVSASSLVSALLLSIRRKRAEIAMLMALGADRRLIFWAFEWVGLRVGLAGVFGGLMLGAGLCLTLAGMSFPLDPEVYPLDHLPMAWRAIDGLVPAAVALALCALASGPIAARAARTRPVEMLGQ